MARKKKITEQKQANGNADGVNSVFGYLNKREFPYKEQTLGDYRKKLDSMNISDLQRHAIEIANILPNVTERHRLIDKLEKTYLEKHARFTAKFMNANTPSSGVTDEAAQSILSILNRGR